MDALAAGTDVVAHDDRIELLGAPDPDASRLIVVSAGNIRGLTPRQIRTPEGSLDHLTMCDLSRIEEPAQAHNVLAVGAFTELTGVPDDPGRDSAHWTAIRHSPLIIVDGKTVATSRATGQRHTGRKPTLVAGTNEVQVRATHQSGIGVIAAKSVPGPGPHAERPASLCHVRGRGRAAGPVSGSRSTGRRGARACRRWACSGRWSPSCPAGCTSSRRRPGRRWRRRLRRPGDGRRGGL
ncbi:S8 family serine peptidase [Streptomyces massasporeus]|uniref:S8 family serine peptidase n=1 Tax=Streptomyces massasporeus TaxID=67324 RepID=UPI0037BD6CBD